MLLHCCPCSCSTFELEFIKKKDFCAAWIKRVTEQKLQHISHFSNLVAMQICANMYKTQSLDWVNETKKVPELNIKKIISHISNSNVNQGGLYVNLIIKSTTIWQKTWQFTDWLVTSKSIGRISKVFSQIINK